MDSQIGSHSLFFNGFFEQVDLLWRDHMETFFFHTSSIPRRSISPRYRSSMSSSIRTSKSRLVEEDGIYLEGIGDVLY